MPAVSRYVGLLLFSFVVAACSKPEQSLSECSFELAKLPHKAQMPDAQRFSFIDACMGAKGWSASSGCRKTTMEGTHFCKYERR